MMDEQQQQQQQQQQREDAISSSAAPDGGCDRGVGAVPERQHIPRDDDSMSDEEDPTEGIRSSAQNLIPPSVAAGFSTMVHSATVKLDEINRSEQVEVAKAKAAEGWNTLRKNVACGWSWCGERVQEAKPHVQEWAQNVEKEAKWLADATLGSGTRQRPGSGAGYHGDSQSAAAEEAVPGQDARPPSPQGDLK
jgi:hypothetical protein